ncbi:trypsin delta-like [Drosophila subpulchrella]|uniref:trypsin delta-like n=1 Tax=Drosophila subpulchrella TaxID=1486046 RepID=UPI0018A197BA|nr:trypsin delta-like [Drosophila subpulchrella]
MFIQWVFLISSVTLISSKGLPERIVGGKAVSILSVPWQASLQKFGDHSCGAAIYSEDIIITAAHCVKNTNVGIYSVRVGSSYTYFGGQVVRVSRILAHEGNAKSMSYDIALIRLQSKLTMNSRVRPIPLASSSPKRRSPATVSGWGAVGFNKAMSTALREVDVDIVDRNQCLRSYGRVITRDMICAAAPGKDACSGDSGGPLVSDGKLVGIVSFGTDCAHPNYPGVYANVAELKPWILSSVKRL